MWWLIALIVIIAAFAVPRLGKALLIAIGIAALAVFGFLSNQKQEEQASKNRISSAEVEFDNLQLLPSYGGSSYRLTGRVRNRSRYTLSTVQLKLTMNDCARELTDAERQRIRELEDRSKQLTFEQRLALLELTRRRDEQKQPNWKKPCETVGESTEYMMLRVPPHQARDVDESVYFSSLATPRGEHVWSYTISEISGK